MNVCKDHVIQLQNVQTRKGHSLAVVNMVVLAILSLIRVVWLLSSAVMMKTVMVHFLALMESVLIHVKYQEHPVDLLQFVKFQSTFFHVFVLLVIWEIPMTQI